MMNMSEHPSRQANKTWVAIRSAFFWILFASSTVIWAFPILLSVVFPLRVRFKVMRVWPHFNLWALKVICGVNYRIEGKENIPATASIVFSKHSSTWETIALQLMLPPAVYVAKKELLYVPFFGWAMSVLNFVTIDRSAGRRAIKFLVDQAKERFSRGLWIIIFPEGTRKAVGAEPDYRIGGAVIAQKCGVPIVPVAHNAGVYWPRHSFLKWPGEIVIAFLPLISSEGKKPDIIRDEVQHVIENKMNELLNLDP